MFKTKKISILLSIILLVLVCFMMSSCGKMDYWDKDELRLIVNIESIEMPSDETVEKSDFEISKEILSSFDELKEGIADFFKSEYNIDIGEKLNKMEINVFSEKISGDSFIGGYTERGQSCININEKIFREHKEYLNSTYLHEAMHYIGFISSNKTMIDDGMAEYMAAKVASYIGIPYFHSECYSFYTLIAEQLCTVNEDFLVKSYLSGKDFDICEHIENTLKNVKQKYLKVDSVGKELNSMVNTLGVDYGEYSYAMAFECQEIIACYCRQFSPSKEQIEQIRKNYFVEDFEKLEVKEVDEGYKIF